MKIFAQVKVNAREVKVEKIDEINYRVSVKEPPTEGKANAAVIAAIADYFGVAKSRVIIVAGHASKKKIIEIV